MHRPHGIDLSKYRNRNRGIPYRFVCPYYCVHVPLYNKISFFRIQLLKEAFSGVVLAISFSSLVASRPFVN